MSKTRSGTSSGGDPYHVSSDLRSLKEKPLPGSFVVSVLVGMFTFGICLIAWYFLYSTVIPKGSLEASREFGFRSHHFALKYLHSLSLVAHIIIGALSNLVLCRIRRARVLWPSVCLLLAMICVVCGILLVMGATNAILNNPIMLSFTAGLSLGTVLGVRMYKRFAVRARQENR